LFEFKICWYYFRVELFGFPCRVGTNLGCSSVLSSSLRAGSAAGGFLLVDFQFRIWPERVLQFSVFLAEFRRPFREAGLRFFRSHALDLLSGQSFISIFVPVSGFNPSSWFLRGISAKLIYSLSWFSRKAAWDSFSPVILLICSLRPLFADSFSCSKFTVFADLFSPVAGLCATAGQIRGLEQSSCCVFAGQGA
jgi:hypothetical protein